MQEFVQGLCLHDDLCMGRMSPWLQVITKGRHAPRLWSAGIMIRQAKLPKRIGPGDHLPQNRAVDEMIRVGSSTNSW